MKIITKNYANITLLKVEQKQVLKLLADLGRHAYVVSDGTSEVMERDAVIYDEELDQLDAKVVSSLAQRLSKSLHCVAFAVINYNDETLLFWLYRAGELIDSYNSQPGYLDPKLEENTPPMGANPEKMAKVFKDASLQEIGPITRRPSYPDENYCTATDRHADIVSVLRLPRFAVGTGFYTVKIGDIPADLVAGDFVPVNIK
ncbi:hypothetical protein J6U76_05140 [bacterium]|nr:hypothetical protein [bacterium]